MAVFVLSLALAVAALAGALYRSFTTTGRLPGPDTQLAAYLDSLFEEGDFEDGIEQYTVSLRLAGVRPPMLEERLGDKLREHGHLEAACEYYSQARKLESTRPLLFQSYAKCLWESGRYDEAIEVATAGCEANAGDPFIRQLLGDYETERGFGSQAAVHYEEARALTAQALEDDLPGIVSGRLYRTHALVLWGLGRKQESIETAHAGSRRYADEYENWSLLGDLYRASEQNVEAIKHYERALQIEPDQAQLRQRIDALRQAEASGSS